MYPTELNYTAEHTWLRLERGNVNRARIGITYYGQEQLKEVVYVQLPEVGSDVTCMEPFCSIESVRSIEDLGSPVSGRVVEVNKSLVNEPGWLKVDPYGRGWLVEVELSSLAELERLLSAQAYQALLKR